MGALPRWSFVKRVVSATLALAAATAAFSGNAIAAVESGLATAIAAPAAPAPKVEQLPTSTERIAAAAPAADAIGQARPTAAPSSVEAPAATEPAALAPPTRVEAVGAAAAQVAQDASALTGAVGETAQGVVGAVPESTETLAEVAAEAIAPMARSLQLPAVLGATELPRALHTTIAHSPGSDAGAVSRSDETATRGLEETSAARPSRPTGDAMPVGARAPASASGSPSPILPPHVEAPSGADFKPPPQVVSAERLTDESARFALPPAPTAPGEGDGLVDGLAASTASGPFFAFAALVAALLLAAPGPGRRLRLRQAHCALPILSLSLERPG